MKKNSKPFIITLTGPSASGKTYVQTKLMACSFFDFNPICFSKYTTRPYRAEEILRLKEKEYVDVKSVDSIPSDCDLVYKTYGKEYGLNTSSLAKELEDGNYPIVVINDIRAVEEIKKKFKGQVLSLFLYRRIPKEKDFQEESKKRGNVLNTESIDRYKKADAMYRMYIENIDLFNRVILNVKKYENKLKEIDYTDLQVKNVLTGVFQNKIQLDRPKKSNSRLFVISGNEKSGKDDIIRAVIKMGKLQAKIVPKYTTRNEQRDDGEEMICKLIPKKESMENFRISFEMQYNKIYNAYDRAPTSEFVLEYKSRKEKLYDVSVAWEIEKLKKLREIKRANQMFWDFHDKQTNKQMCFETNKKYINLEKIDNLQNSTKRRGINSEIICYEGRHNDEKIIIYGNHQGMILYGFKIDKLKSEMQSDGKHRVLVASVIDVIKKCKKYIGNNNVVSIYVSSQISEEEYVKEEVGGDEIINVKKTSFTNNGIDLYSHNIVEYDNVIIYAESSLINESGGKQEELIDQIFRLFRAY